MPRSASRGKKYRPPAAPAAAAPVTADEALQFAVRRHQEGDLDAAQAVYEALLGRRPDDIGALSHLGILLHQRGQHEGSLALLRRAADLAPESAGIWNNLGNLLFQQERVDEAEQAFARSLAIAESAPAHTNLARLWRRRSAWTRSEAACRRAIELDAGAGEAWHHLALALLGQGRVAEGFECAVKATLLLPAHARRRDAYARALLQSGEKDKAIAIYREWLAEEPDNAVARHHLAACTGEQVPARAGDDYVEQVFDRFASSFDSSLARLGYRGPELVAAALAVLLPPPARQFDVADLGCGTGLCGPLVRERARTLTGCDLSAGMIAQARRRAVYDELVKSELVAFLADRPQAFDLLVCADTLIYFGDLAGVMAAARHALRPDGRLAFTVEALDDANGGFALRGSGRYAHGLAHVRAALEQAGMALETVAAAVLRQEGGEPVGGRIVVALRSA